MTDITNIQLEDHVKVSDVLAEVGSKRKSYVMLYVRDNMDEKHIPETTGVQYLSSISDHIIYSGKHMIHLSCTLETLPSNKDLQIIDEIIVDDSIADTLTRQRQFITTRFRRQAIENKGYTVFFHKILNPENFVAIKLSKINKELLETITGTVWEPWHKCHVYHRENLVLKVLWDRREIMHAEKIHDDSLEVLMQAQQDDDNLIRYSAYKKDLEVLESIHSEIDWIIHVPETDGDNLTIEDI